MAQLVEHIVHIDGVIGSSPIATTQILSLRIEDFFFYPRISAQKRELSLAGSKHWFGSAEIWRARLDIARRQGYNARINRWGGRAMRMFGKHDMLNNLLNKSGNGNGNNTVGLALPYAFFRS